jgi:flavin-dependent dehydrogenase
MLTQCKVLRIASEGRSGLPTGVHYETITGTTGDLAADLIVDASGRGVAALDFLKTFGWPIPEETAIGVDIRYSSAFFAIPDSYANADFRATVSFPSAPKRVRYGYLLPTENNRWHVLLVGRGDDVPPIDGEAFLEYASELETPTIYKAIRNAKRLTEVARFAFPESLWRHFGRLGEFPSGLIVMGDGVCRFNPVWGQGMAVALEEARILRKLLATQPASPHAIATVTQTFLAQTESFIAQPWELSALPDFVFPNTRGPRPADLANKLQFYRALQRVAARDAELFRLVAEIRSLLKPTSALDTPEIQLRIEQELAAA